MKSIGMEYRKTCRGPLASVLLAALGVASAMPAVAQTVEYNGALVDRSKIAGHEAQQRAFANKGAVAPKSVPSYGDHWSSYTFGACDASIRSGVNFTAGSCDENRSNADAVTANIGYPIHLPHGSRAQFVYYWYSDTDPGSNPSAGLWYSNNTGATTLVSTMTPGGTFSGGNTAYFSSGFSHTVDNWNNNYSVLMLLGRNGAEEEKFYRGIVFYKLQVAPAPATASFLDVPTSSPFHRFVEALVDAGTTAGCGGGNYCPDAPVTRAQMAVFLSQVLGLNWAADVTPAP